MQSPLSLRHMQRTRFWYMQTMFQRIHQRFLQQKDSATTQKGRKYLFQIFLGTRIFTWTSTDQWPFLETNGNNGYSRLISFKRWYAARIKRRYCSVVLCVECSLKDHISCFAFVACVCYHENPSLPCRSVQYLWWGEYKLTKFHRLCLPFLVCSTASAGQQLLRGVFTTTEPIAPEREKN